MISSKEIINETLSYEEYFNAYLIMNLSMLFLKSVIPMALSIHSYFSFTYIRINKLFVFIWTVLLLGGLSYNIVELNICSIFFLHKHYFLYYFDYKYFILRKSDK